MTVQVKVDTQEYGKTNVRLIKVSSLAADPKAPGLTRHSCVEYTAQVLLGGRAFDSSYSQVNNSMVVATDTVKNTIYAWAKQTSQPSLETPELFARELAVHFLSTFDHVDSVNVKLLQHRWSRILTTTLEPTDTASGFPGTHVGAAPKYAHPHSFYRDGDEKRVVKLFAERVRTGKFSFSIRYTLRSGLSDLLVLKTTGSSFQNFHKSQYRTLADAADRLLSTSVDAFWKFATVEETDSQWKQDASSLKSPFTKIEYDKIYVSGRQTVLDIFANHKSPSVQHTLYIIGQTIIENVPQIESVALKLPNKHSFPFNLEPFGMKNHGQVGTGGADVFQPISEPSGLITATIGRKTSKL